MAGNLLNGQDLRIDPANGAVTMTLHGNANTFVKAMGSWLSLNPAVAELTAPLGNGAPLIVPISNPADIVGSLLSFSLQAAARDSQDPHLFVHLNIFQAGSSNLLVSQDYRFDLPSGFNAWELSDGVTLRV